MSKFITVNPSDMAREPWIINADEITTIIPLEDGRCNINFKTMHSINVHENFDTMASMLMSDTNVDGKNNNVLSKFTGKELQEAIRIERSRCKCTSISCSRCEWHDEYVDCDRSIIADYINKKLRGETK